MVVMRMGKDPCINVRFFLSADLFELFQQMRRVDLISAVNDEELSAFFFDDKTFHLHVR